MTTTYFSQPICLQLKLYWIRDLNRLIWELSHLKGKNQKDFSIIFMYRDIEKLIGLFPIFEENQKQSKEQLSTEIGNLRSQIQSVATRVT